MNEVAKNKISGMTHVARANRKAEFLLAKLIIFFIKGKKRKVSHLF
jgi:hypothetical protein